VALRGSTANSGAPEVSCVDVATAIEQRGGLNHAIAALGSRGRMLRPVADVEEWSDAVLSTVALADPERPVSVDALVEQFAPEVEVHRAKPLWKKAAWVLLALIHLVRSRCRIGAPLVQTASTRAGHAACAGDKARWR
jgi:hypothetical protein